MTADGRPARRARARTRTCSGRCAAAAGASRSSPPCGCGRTACAPARVVLASTIRRGARAEVLAAWDDLAPSAPSALTCTSILQRWRRRARSAFGQYLGSGVGAAAADRARSPACPARAGEHGPGELARAAAPLGGVRRRRAVDLPARHVDDASTRRRSTSRASSARRRATRSSSAADGGATLLLDSYGGAIGRSRRDATAFVHRNVRFSVQILSYAPIWRRPSPTSTAPAAGSRRSATGRPTRTTPTCHLPNPLRPTTAPTCRACGRSRPRWIRRGASGSRRGSADRRLLLGRRGRVARELLVGLLHRLLGADHVHHRVDQREVGEGLREVAEVAARAGVDLLRVEAERAR